MSGGTRQESSVIIIIFFVGQSDESSRLGLLSTGPTPSGLKNAYLNILMDNLETNTDFLVPVLLPTLLTISLPR